jgi:hypothetical protein
LDFFIKLAKEEMIKFSNFLQTPNLYFLIGKGFKSFDYHQFVLIFGMGDIKIYLDFGKKGNQSINLFRIQMRRERSFMNSIIIIV